MNIYTIEENNLLYQVVETTAEELDAISLDDFFSKYEYSKFIVKNVGTFYHHYKLFHNEFGPSIIFNIVKWDKPGDNLGYHINGKALKEKIFNRYIKLKHLKNDIPNNL
jgi:hypothetical protein